VLRSPVMTAVVLIVGGVAVNGQVIGGFRPSM